MMSKIRKFLSAPELAALLKDKADVEVVDWAVTREQSPRHCQGGSRYVDVLAGATIEMDGEEEGEDA
jgi:hypothetical protein